MEANTVTQETGSAKVQPNNIRISCSQDERRQAILELQNELCEEHNKKRKLLKIDQESKHGMRWMERYAKTIKRPIIRNESYEIVMSLMKSEHMSTVPEDIDDWIATLCPVGKHCCVVVQDNYTKVFNKFGTVINCFQSLFPQTIPMNHPSHRKRTILDCIYNNKLKKYYILDIIEWMGVPYTDFEAQHRFSFIRWKLRKIPGIDEKSEKNCYPFELAPRMVANELYPLLLEKFQFFPEDVKLDSINFYYSGGLYTPGETPLVLRLNPFMIPDVLKKPVHDRLALKPLNCENIDDYVQGMKRKHFSPLREKNITNLNSEEETVLEDLDMTETDEDFD